MVYFLKIKIIILFFLLVLESCTLTTSETKSSNSPRSLVKEEEEKICYKTSGYIINKTERCREMNVNEQGNKDSYNILLKNRNDKQYDFKCTEKSQIWIDTLINDVEKAKVKADNLANYISYQTGRTGTKTRFHWNNLKVDKSGVLTLKYHRTDKERGEGGRCETRPIDRLASKNFDFSIKVFIPKGLSAESTGVYTVALFSEPFEVEYEMDILFGLRKDSKWEEPELVLGNPEKANIIPFAQPYRTSMKQYEGKDTILEISKRGDKCRYYIDNAEVFVNSKNREYQNCRSPSNQTLEEKKGFIIVNSRGNYVDKPDKTFQVKEGTEIPLIKDEEGRDTTTGIIYKCIKFREYEDDHLTFPEKSPQGC